LLRDLNNLRNKRRDHREISARGFKNEHRVNPKARRDRRRLNCGVAS
jgi:hypothetical protein